MAGGWDRRCVSCRVPAAPWSLQLAALQNGTFSWVFNASAASNAAVEMRIVDWDEALVVEEPFHRDLRVAYSGDPRYPLYYIGSNYPQLWHNVWGYRCADCAAQLANTGGGVRFLQRSELSKAAVCTCSAMSSFERISIPLLGAQGDMRVPGF